MTPLEVGHVWHSRTGQRMAIVAVERGFIYFAVSPWRVKVLRERRFRDKAGIDPVGYVASP